MVTKNIFRFSPMTLFFIPQFADKYVCILDHPYGMQFILNGGGWWACLFVVSEHFLHLSQ
jgi:hypothetical protein